ncbi:protein of unknown function [Burkholderia multivorans]
MIQQRVWALIHCAAQGLLTTTTFTYISIKTPVGTATGGCVFFTQKAYCVEDAVSVNHATLVRLRKLCVR